MITTSQENQLSADLNVITAEINSFKQVAGQSIFEIGRRLEHVRDEIFSDSQRKQSGEWASWLKTVGLSNTVAKNMIQAYNQLGVSLTSGALPNWKVFELLHLPEAVDREEFVQTPHVVPSTNETKTVDEMTVRELREVKAALKAAEAEKISYAEQLRRSAIGSSQARASDRKGSREAG
jgi:hypothetical protein